MNNQKLENKVREDAANVKKDMGVMVEDSAALLSSFEDNVSHATGKAKDDLTNWVEGSVSRLSTGFEKATSDVGRTAENAAKSVKNDVGRGLRQYNAKAQKTADKIPGGLGKQAASYPWVAMSIALVIGLLLGSLLNPTRQHHG
jgi:ElaB/YqjD/DUF883 family membrane-anchored ribosome-binding protein